MAFDLSTFGAFGNRSNGQCSDPDNFINAYALTDSLADFSFNAYPAFQLNPIIPWDESCVGSQIMLHALAANNGDTALLGRYIIATVTACTADSDNGGFRVTINKSLAEFAAAQDKFFFQAITVPSFTNLTIKTKDLRPINVSYGWRTGGPCGGVLVFKCSETFTMAGAHVDLRDCGFDLNIANSRRPLLNHETNGTLDTDLYSGCENSITKDRLLVNGGDGACLIMARTINSSSGASRIGNPKTAGVQYCRGASDSKNAPDGVTNLGGSTIAIVTNLWNNFTPNLIAKYRSGTAGRGLARAYIALLNGYNNIRPDEGLYALDTVNNPKRLKSMCNISGFGKGTDGSYSITSYNASKCWNSYAKVTAVSGRVYTIRRVYAEVNELADFEVGRLVMIHQSRKASAPDYLDGNFKLSRITAVSGSTITIKHNFTFDLSTYYVQMILVPEYLNVTLSTEYKNALPFSDGVGGILAIACNGTLNISSGKINMAGKGTFSDVVNPGIGNYSMKGTLPIGQGHGSVFILARNLIMNTSTRIGATYDGAAFGGRGGSGTKSNYPAGGGWAGHDNDTGEKTGGWGGGAGHDNEYEILDGGWHSNAAGVPDSAIAGSSTTGCHGAHILIVADSISGLNLSALSTGGGAGYDGGVYGQLPGGCGYGGGGKVISDGTASAGGYRGGGVGKDFKVKLKNGNVDHGGGGGSGACFVYANNISDQNSSGIVIS